jgi:hypothetical protein
MNLCDGHVARGLVRITGKGFQMYFGWSMQSIVHMQSLCGYVIIAKLSGCQRQLRAIMTPGLPGLRVNLKSWKIFMNITKMAS